jgi:cysteine desulfurase
MLYFDHNATSPLSAAARRAWLEAHDRFVANPASQHRLGQRADVALEAARTSLAGLLGVSAGELIWTSGATESANTVMAHLAATGSGSERIWVSPTEHPCVLEAARRCFPGRVEGLEVDRNGVLQTAALRVGLERERPVAVVLMAANNETGVLQPWSETARICREAGVPMVCDATQWLGRSPGQGLGECDYLIGSGHKCGGPVGTGFLRVPSVTASFSPLIRGGAQEEGRRAGTQNVAGAMALVAALEDCAGRLDGVAERLEVRRRFEEELGRLVPGALVVGGGAERLWNTVMVSLPALGDCRQRWVVRLDAAGVAASTGSACASGSEKVSHVLEAMGVSAEVSGRTLRFSAGWETTEAEWSEVLGVIGRVRAKLG